MLILISVMAGVYSPVWRGAILRALDKAMLNVIVADSLSMEYEML